MTNEEAIKKVSMVKMLAVKSSTDTAVAMDMAIEALKEQQPKKPHYTTLRYIVKGEEVSVKHPECPKCIKNSGLYLWDAEIERGQAFCKRCGQAIDWSKETTNRENDEP